MPVRPVQKLLSDRDRLGVAGLAHVRRADLGLTSREPCLDLKPQTRPILRDEASLCPHVATDVVGVELDRSGVHRMGEIDDVPK